MKNLIFSIFCLATTTCMGQIAQMGKTLQYNGTNTKATLDGVSISAIGAPTTVSNENGDFTLNFRVLHAGDKVNIRRIEKSGFEVFNPDQLEQWNISAKGEAYNIVLCSTEFLNNKKSEYRNSALSVYEERLKKAEQRESENKQKGLITEEEYEARIFAIEEEHEKQLDRIETYIDRIARIDLTEINGEELEIINLVKQSKFDEAIRAYDKLNLVSKYKKERAAIQKLEAGKKAIEEAQTKHENNSKELYEALQRQINVLRLAGGEENFAKIGDLLKGLVEADTTQVNAAIDYAIYLKGIEQHELASKVITQAIHCSKDWIEIINTKSIYATIQSEFHNYAKCDTILKECLALVEKNAANVDELDIKTLQAVIRLHHDMAGNALRMDQDSVALAYCQSATELSQKLYSFDNSQFLLLAKTYSYWSQILISKERPHEARILLEKALHLFDGKEQNKTNLYELVGIKVKLVSTQNFTKDPVQIEHCLRTLQEAEDIWKILYQNNPRGMLYNYAIFKFQAGINYWTFRKEEEFRKNIDESIELFTKLIPTNPQKMNLWIEKLKQHREDLINEFKKFQQ